MKNWLLTAACGVIASTIIIPNAADAAPANDVSTQRAVVYRAVDGVMLSRPSSASPEAIVKAFATEHGRDPATLRLVGAPRLGKNGVTHLQFEQVIDGYRVAGKTLKASVDARGQLIFVADNLTNLSRSFESPQISARQALNAAMMEHAYGPAANLRELGRQGNITNFDRGAAFHEGPTVERILYVDSGEKLRAGFEVMTWSQQGNRLHYTIVGANGRIEAVELRTNNDSYNVFAIDPLKSSQAIVSGPAPGGATSPLGWLNAGGQNSINIAGNNVSAYLDANRSDDRPDQGGVAVDDGNFLTAADLGVQPSTPSNQEVAVQNLFYLNNVVHDILYQAGFDEAAGNFQNDNFGKGGAERDAVNAEAQDGSGTDNANFSTPRDGRKPRMQMYLWTGAGADYEVATSGNIYDARGAEFGPALDELGVTGEIVLSNDGAGLSLYDACEGGGVGLSGKIALVDRGNCNFTDKVLNAQLAGAIGVIVANNVDGDALLIMGGSSKRIRIPSVLVSQNSGAALKAQLGGLNATERKRSPAPLMLDAALDTDIVFHEYGHGLTWRMIGGMSGPISGAIGEGASDVLAFLINADDKIGEYSASYVDGIRRYPYVNYPFTYIDVAFEEEHDDGEIYAAIMWRLGEIFLTNSKTLDDLLGLFVDAMNYTPSSPAFEDMRDGLLASDMMAGGVSKCQIWSAFAQFGVGTNSSGTYSGSTGQIVESFAVPPECS